jgi:hypothetical protein
MYQTVNFRLVLCMPGAGVSVWSLVALVPLSLSLSVYVHGYVYVFLWVYVYVYVSGCELWAGFVHLWSRIMGWFCTCMEHVRIHIYIIPQWLMHTYTYQFIHTYIHTKSCSGLC